MKNVNVDVICSNMIDPSLDDQDGLNLDGFQFESLGILRDAAENGNGTAAYLVGRLFFNGWSSESASIAVDKEKAVDYFCKGAELGNAYAQRYYATCLHEGIGGKTDNDAAFQWLVKAADQGDAHALYELASIYLTGGWGQPVDLNKALSCCKAIEKKNIDANEGDNVYLEFAKGHSKFLPAIIKGDRSAMLELSKYFKEEVEDVLDGWVSVPGYYNLSDFWKEKASGNDWRVELKVKKCECTRCHGTGKVTCSKCGGKKDVKCEKCNGTGKHQCHSCDGSGKVECSSCDGTGDEIKTCPVCYRGKVKKERVINCGRCHGTGISGYSPSGQPYSCGACDGRGQLIEPYYEICPNCHGEYRKKVGSCKSCGGTGRRTCYSCKGEKTVRCGECSGTGKHDCHVCKGTGAVNCPDCDKREREAKEKREREEREARERQERKEREERDRRKAAKERKDAIQGCGCLLAIAAVAGFFIWWWVEGLTMSALPGMWEQAKNMLGGSALGTIAKLGGAVVVLLIVWGLIKGIRGKKGEVSTSPKKRWKFVVLGILFGFFGIHLAYAKRWLLFLLLWAGFITGNVMSDTKGGDDKPADEIATQQVEPSDKSTKTNASTISNIGFGVWALLWIGGTLFIKKDGKGNRM